MVFGMAVHHPYIEYLAICTVMVGNDKVTIRFWGVRGSIPCPGSAYTKFGGNTSCVELQVPGMSGFLLLDSGSGIRQAGDQLISKNRQSNGSIFVTHGHWDHIQGFPFFMPIYDPNAKVNIYYPGSGYDSCKSVMTYQLHPTHFPVSAESLHADISYIDLQEEAVRTHEYSVDYMLADHPIRTAIFRIHIAGKTIIYAPDNELKLSEPDSESFIHDFMEFIRDADVLIHDGNYNRETYGSKRNWGHSAWEDVVDVAGRAGVRNLYLTHHDPSATDDLMADRCGLLSASSGLFNSVQFAREGTDYIIG